MKLSKIYKAQRVAMGRDPLSPKVGLVLRVTSALKKALSGKVADIATAIIPGDLDETIRQALLRALDAAAKALTSKDNEKAAEAPMKATKQLYRTLRTMPEAAREAMLQKTASIMLRELDNGIVRDSDSDLFTQSYFTLSK